MEIILSFDVGGTTIKSAIISTTGDILIKSEQFRSNAYLEKDKLLTHLCNIIQSQVDIALQNGYTPVRSCIGFPGPFDYEKGICLLDGMGKFDSLFGVNLKEHFHKQFQMPFSFANDADLYTLGACNFTDCNEFNKIICVCIGTGIGSGFFNRPSLIKAGKGVPLDGFIYHLPFRDSIMDNYLSATGLRTMIKQSPVSDLISDVSELAELAYNGNPIAKNIFSEFSQILCEALPPIVVEFGAECLVVGGQVAKSADLFIEPLKAKLNSCNVKLNICDNSTELALRAGCLL